MTILRVFTVLVRLADRAGCDGNTQRAVVIQCPHLIQRAAAVSLAFGVALPLELGIFARECLRHVVRARYV